MDDETIGVYGRKAADYEAFGLTPTQIRGMEALIDGLPEGAHIFDLGCGPGMHGAAFLARGFRVSALDATPEFVAAAQARGVDARLGTFDDVTEVAAYDGLWASFSLLHARRADVPRHLAAAALAVKPGGRLFLGLKTGTGEQRDAIGRFYSYHTVEELRAMFADCGMRVVWEEAGAEAGMAGTVDPFVMMVAEHA